MALQLQHTFKRAHNGLPLEALQQAAKADYEQRQADALNMSGDIANTGGINSGTGAIRDNEEQLRIKKKKRDDARRDAITAQQLINHLQEEIEELQGRYDSNQKKINKIDDKIEATETILLLIASDDFAPDNEEHLALMKRAGIDPKNADGSDKTVKQVKPEAEQTLDTDLGTREKLVQKNAVIQEQINIRERAIEDLQAERQSPQAVIKRLEAQGITVEIKAGQDLRGQLSIDSENLEKQRSENKAKINEIEGVKTNLTPSEVTEIITVKESKNGGLDVDDETEAFMKDYAEQVKDYSLEGAAMMMDDHIESLSEDARLVLENTEDVKHLFAGDETEAPNVSADPNIKAENMPVTMSNQSAPITASM